MMIIETKMLDELIESVLHSAYLKDEKPISLLLIAPPEHLKSSSLIAVADQQNILVTSFTPFGYLRDFHGDVKKGNIRYLLIPDIYTLFSRKETAKDVIGFLLDLIEHGIVNISKYWNEGVFNVVDERVNLGLIMTSTPLYITDRRHRWLYENGFISRFLSISYSYSDELLSRIHEEIIKERSVILRRKLQFPNESIEVICKPRFIRKLNPLMQESQRKMKSYGIRAHDHVRCLIKANARKHRREEVTWEDTIEVGAFLKFFNLDTNPIRDFEILKDEVREELKL